MTKLLLSITILFIFNSAFCQREPEKVEKPMNLKKDQLTLDIESPLGVGFTSAWKVSLNSSVGLGFQFGLGPRVMLNNAEFLYCGEGCDEGDCCDFHYQRLAGQFILELAQVQTFWRYYFTPRTYFNAGIYASFNKFIMFELNPGATITGIKTGIYTGFKRLKFGLNMQGGKVFIRYSNDKKTDFYLGYAWPVIQVYF